MNESPLTHSQQAVRNFAVIMGTTEVFARMFLWSCSASTVEIWAARTLRADAYECRLRANGLFSNVG